MYMYLLCRTCKNGGRVNLALYQLSHAHDRGTLGDVEEEEVGLVPNGRGGGAYSV